MTNEANGASGATDNRQPTTDNRRMALALLALLFCAGIVAAFAASVGVIVTESSQPAYGVECASGEGRGSARLPGHVPGDPPSAVSTTLRNKPQPVGVFSVT